MSIKAIWAIVAAFLAAGVTVTVVIVKATSGPTRSAAAFCAVYFQQKHQYLSTYASHNYQNDPLGGLVNAIGAISDWVPMFEKMDAVAPPEIEPDVQNIVDSLKQQEQEAGQAASNPLAAISSSLVTGMMSSASWDHVSQYVEQNCHGG